MSKREEEMSKTEEHFQSKAEEYAAEFWQHECDGVYQTRHDYLAGCEYGYQYARKNLWYNAQGDTVPEYGREVIVIGRDITELFQAINVTHWMEIVPPPRKEE